MENKLETQQETVTIPRYVYRRLLDQRSELEQTVIFSTDVILIFVDLLGGKLPQSKKDIILLLPKLPKLIDSLSDEKKRSYLQEAFKNILETAPKYITEKQVEKLKAMDLLPLQENL